MDDQLPKTHSTDALAARTATAVRDLQALAQSVTVARRERMSQLEADLTDRLDAIAGAIAEQRASHSESFAEAARSQTELDAWRAELDVRERELAKRGEQLGEEDRRQQQVAGELTKRESELDQRASQLAQQKSELDAARIERDEAAAEAVSAELEGLQRRIAELQSQVATFERERDETNAQAEEFATRQSEWAAARLALELERDQLTSDLADALEQDSAESANSALTGELDELKQKFALALEDVQRFRARVATLEQELAERPSGGDSDSAEVVALRAERDALIEKVTELESCQPLANAVDGQELADLQRRFELAVEDVRELKTKNARLESQLASSHQPAQSAGDASGMDWESQKRRLLASLEGASAEQIEDGERITIANTIQITDAVVAEKDVLIEELKSQLAAKADAPIVNQDAQQQATNELLDSDEIIAAHRQKAAELEQALEAKLRTFELEMSVDRAKIARQKVELDQLKLDLEAERNALPGASGNSNGPKRRWLSKLGLGGDDE